MSQWLHEQTQVRNKVSEKKIRRFSQKDRLKTPISANSCSEQLFGGALCWSVLESSSGRPHDFFTAKLEMFRNADRLIPHESLSLITFSFTDSNFFELIKRYRNIGHLK